MTGRRILTPEDREKIGQAVDLVGRLNPEVGAALKIGAHVAEEILDAFEEVLARVHRNHLPERLQADKVTHTIED